MSGSRPPRPPPPSAGQAGPRRGGEAGPRAGAGARGVNGQHGTDGGDGADRAGPPGRAGAGRAGAGRAGAHGVGWKATFFGIMAVVIVAGAAWALLGSRFLIVRSVQVTGTGPLVSAAQVRAAARIQPGLPLIRISTAAVARRVERIQQVQSARVSRDWPDTVVIAVRVRTAMFAVPAQGGYALVDAFGVRVRQVARRPSAIPLFTAGSLAPGSARAGSGTAGAHAGAPGGSGGHATPAGQPGGPGAPGATAAPPLASLRGSPAVRAAAAVLGELPRSLRRQVRLVGAASAADVSVRLADGVVIVWGDASRSAEKTRELGLLMRTHARLYDVSAPGSAVTRG
jgi:cell division protein FtsQ